jgi:levansucrase
MTTPWLPAHVEAIDAAALPAAPLIDPARVERLLPGIDLWDYWPVQTPEGAAARIADGELCLFLSAPVVGDPEARHGLARLRFLHRGPAGWRDLGPLFPDGFTPGSREWAGSAVLEDDRVSVYFTAAGEAGEAVPGFHQRLYVTQARLSAPGGVPALDGWTRPAELVRPDGATYVRDLVGGGGIGTIKAFRDPAFFRDPADGADYLLFAGSLAASASPWNGAIGVARRRTDGWALEAPLVAADGLNNELERPHAVAHAGRYYLFWSTQRHVFADGGPAGPTGLYGMVADRFAGPYAPLNGTGLVVANPPSAPAQAFSWLVLPDGRTLSFADSIGLPGRPRDAEEARRHFGGTPAPELRLRLDGASATLA